MVVVVVLPITTAIIIILNMNYAFIMYQESLNVLYVFTHIIVTMTRELVAVISYI